MAVTRSKSLPWHRRHGPRLFLLLAASDLLLLLLHGAVAALSGGIWPELVGARQALAPAAGGGVLDLWCALQLAAVAFLLARGRRSGAGTRCRPLALLLVLVGAIDLLALHAHLAAALLPELDPRLGKVVVLGGLGVSVAAVLVVAGPSRPIVRHTVLCLGLLGLVAGGLDALSTALAWAQGPGDVAVWAEEVVEALLTAAVCASIVARLIVPSRDIPAGAGRAGRAGGLPDGGAASLRAKRGRTSGRSAALPL